MVYSFNKNSRSRTSHFLRIEFWTLKVTLTQIFMRNFLLFTVNLLYSLCELFKMIHKIGDFSFILNFLLFKPFFSLNLIIYCLLAAPNYIWLHYFLYFMDTNWLWWWIMYAFFQTITNINSTLIFDSFMFKISAFSFLFICVNGKKFMFGTLYIIEHYILSKSSKIISSVAWKQIWRKSSRFSFVIVFFLFNFFQLFTH